MTSFASNAGVERAGGGFGQSAGKKSPPFTGGDGGDSGGGGADGSWDAPDDDGLTIILSPVQLAAILTRKTLSGHDRFINRLWGGGQLFLSALQLVGAVSFLVAPDPTLITKAGGSVLGLHAIDSGIAGGRQLWTGEQTKDLTQRAGERTARGLGASDKEALWAGIALDAAVPLAAGSALGAERVLAVRAGRISLVAEEAAGGHTISKHVGQTESALRARLADPNNKAAPAATSFKHLRMAENLVTEALVQNKRGIEVWTSAGCKGKFRIDYKTSAESGYGVVRATGKLVSMQNVRVVLTGSKQAGRLFFILTAFPDF